MLQIKQFAKRATFFVAAVLVLAGYPVSTSADTTTSPQQGPTQPTGPQQPTGPDANTYHFNSATGLWENDYYTWNPATNQTTPKTNQSYSYNPATGAWDTNNYKYDPTSGSYVPNVPTAVNATPTGSGSSTNSDTGPDSTNTDTQSNSGNATFNTFYNATISNKTLSQATTGDATVANNTIGGDAISGNAAVIATAINLLQSSASFAGSNGVTVFTSNVNKDINGNLLVDPSLLSTLQPAATGMTLPNDVTINNQGSGAINNDIHVGSTSGDASVTNNTQGGNATSGDANSVVNLINAINSSVIAPNTFIGTINIYGSLNGNILLPGDVLQSLVASNGANATDTGNQSNSLDVTNASSQTINNNIATNAVSGAASTNGNTEAGTATSGAAKTNVTLLNLTGHQVVGSDSILVFVNVLGNWVGMIMDAPSSATAAALGGGTSNHSTSANATVNSSSAQTINNNVVVSAKTGDASVTGNSVGGDATSGNASSSANVLNLTNDSLALTNWFGILFINVFGSWNGSFCANPSECTAPVTTPNTTSQNTTSGQDSTSAPASFPTTAGAQQEQGFSLAAQSNTGAGGSFGSTSDDSNGSGSTSAILGASTSAKTHAPASPLHTAAKKNWQFTASGLTIGVSLILVERLLALHDRRKKLTTLPA